MITLQRHDPADGGASKAKAAGESQASLNRRDAGDSVLGRCNADQPAIPPGAFTPRRIDDEIDGAPFDQPDGVFAAVPDLVDASNSNAVIGQVPGRPVRGQDAKPEFVE